MRDAHRTPRILLVDDDQAVRDLVRDCLEEIGCLVREASRTAEVLDMAGRERPDLVLLDIVGIDAQGVMRGLRALYPDMPIVLLTGLGRDEVERRLAGMAGGIGVIYKPFDLQDLLERVQGTMAHPA